MEAELKNVVAEHLNCETEHAQYLSIHDLQLKMPCEKIFDIGGTYSNGPDFWFLFKNRSFAKNNFLMYLFVCNRKAGSYTVLIGDPPVGHISSFHNEARTEQVYIELGENPESYSFINVPMNTYSFVKAFKFTEKDYGALINKELLIEISIAYDDNILSKDVRDAVQLNHHYGNLLKHKYHSDLTLESIDGHKFSCHKFILAAQSSVLKNMMLADSSSHLKVSDTKLNLELILSFMYTGKLDNVKKENYGDLLDMAVKYNLSVLKEPHIYHISVENAVDILLIAYKNNMTGLSKKIFSFIRNNPEVYKTNAWVGLKDVELIKELVLNISGEKRC